VGWHDGEEEACTEILGREWMRRETREEGWRYGEELGRTGGGREGGGGVLMVGE
jgi:hypothetical protein